MREPLDTAKQTVKRAFHHLWGHAKDHKYEKREWADFQKLLDVYFGEVDKISKTQHDGDDPNGKSRK
jgi:hypothetical protein